MNVWWRACLVFLLGAAPAEAAVGPAAPAAPRARLGAQRGACGLAC